MMNNSLYMFQSFRRILCICPCCGEMVRLSDLHLTHTGKAPKTWLDKHESKYLSLQKKQERFEEKEKKIREKTIERGRKKVPKMIMKCLYPELRKLRYDPYDMKPLMDPVDFTVFNGLNKGDKVTDITLLTRKTQDTNLSQILKSIQDTIDRENYDWKVARITIDGKVDFE